MATKGKKIDTYIHEKYGVEVEIRLETKTGTFTASVYEKHLSNNNLNAIKDSIKETIEANAKLEWIPIIVVRNRPPDGNHHKEDQEMETVLKIERFYVAKRHDGMWSEVAWHINAEDMYKSRFGIMKSEHTTEELRLMNARHTSYKAENLPLHIGNENRFRGSPHVSVFAYTEELWNGLLQMITAYHALNQRVADMLKQEDHTKMIASTAQAMLPATTEN